MKYNLAQALSWIDQSEGPELNVGPSEPGGSSCHGVSMTVLAEWNAQHLLAPPTMNDMRAMTAEFAGQIYTTRFADPIRFNDLPSGVDYRLLDIAVNLGVTGGATILQLALCLWPLTGVVDDATLDAVRSKDSGALILALSAAWITKKHESPSWAKYGHGWSNRNIRATVLALGLVGKTPQ